MLTSALLTLVVQLAPALATPVNASTRSPPAATPPSPWQPATWGRSYSGSLLTNDVDDQVAASAAGGAQFSPVAFDGDYYRSRYSDQYLPREEAEETTQAKTAAQDRKDERVRPHSRRRPRPRPPSDRHGHDEYDDYEDRDGEYGYGYGYEADDGYYEHGGGYGYGGHHLQHHGYDSHRFRPQYHTHHASPVYLPQHEDHSDKYLKFGALAVLKLVLAKIKALGVFKVLLLLAIKLPIFLFTLLFKFFLVTKFFKLLTLPLLLLPLLLLVPLLLLPLLPLAPLLLLPLLLPLLLLLPVPVLTPGTAAGNGGRRRRSADAGADSEGVPGAASGVVAGHDLLALTRQVLEADRCLERIACQLAEKQRSTVYNSFVIWVLEKIHLRVAPERVRPRLSSYLEAYRHGASTEGQCQSRYACDRAKLGLYRGSLLQQLL